MDTVLRSTLGLACQIRDSAEAKAWREAWNVLSSAEFRAWESFRKPTVEIPLTEYIRLVRSTDAAKSRPLMLPLLLSRFSPNLDAARFQTELGERPELQEAFQQMLKCFGLISLIVAFLRRAGPGYPHRDLIYTLPKTPWLELSSMKEVPWNLGEFLPPNGTTDAEIIGLHRVIPTASSSVADRLNDLLESIKNTRIWLELGQTFAAINQRRNLTTELGRARIQFEREMAQISRLSIPKAVWQAKVEDLAQRVYARRGTRIKAYVESFLEYERLIEGIYWILSQLAVYKLISCLISSDDRQLQQIGFGNGKPPLLTALAPTLARTLQVGQLVHITLPETEHELDGLYQVEQLFEKYQLETGSRVLLRSRCLWYCDLPSILEQTRQFSEKTFIPSECIDIGDSTRIDISGPNGKVTSWRIRDSLLSVELPGSMYLQ